MKQADTKCSPETAKAIEALRECLKNEFACDFSFVVLGRGNILGASSANDGAVAAVPTYTPAKDNPNRVKPWCITQLAEELQKDLAQCTTVLERSNCEALARKEMRELANEIAKTRVFTPGELSVLSHYAITF